MPGEDLAKPHRQRVGAEGLLQQGGLSGGHAPGREGVRRVAGHEQYADLGPQRRQHHVARADQDAPRWPQIRRLAAKTLSAAGYLVPDAAHGEEALALAATSELDLALTDVVMPRMSGVTLAEQMVLLQPAVRILFMSGYPVSENRELRCASR